ncbi:Putative Cellulose-binding domain, fungal, Cellulose-binding domain superfamily [Septoria linicola]|uniref:Cellulose-binding domain, fungal, Cellulose-binding domain superfamily n=1 Tax=Septoria linicola TaxID=215465 RepID=A0A9Q9AZS4_9PEZI|nr:putative Cellulose-binding domain, fungal, Cellulose-binding domain superfamily [Septoria linicola]USW59032.1 Putative Cellulose-binding domain, fungal, Cellulose-binding domain superfamily [Septoria linicola]
MRVAQRLQLCLLLTISVHAAVSKKAAGYDCMATFYDGAAPNSSEEEHGKAPSTHSEAVMAEERRLEDEHRRQQRKDFVALATTMKPIYKDDNRPIEYSESHEVDQHDVVEAEAIVAEAAYTPKQQLKRQAPRRPWNPPNGVVPVYGQCGGRDYFGPQDCDFDTFCHPKDQYYSQCVPLPTPPGYVDRYGQCGGENYFGNTLCRPDTFCTYQKPFYSQCL